MEKGLTFSDYSPIAAAVIATLDPTTQLFQVDVRMCADVR